MKTYFKFMKDLRKLIWAGLFYLISCCAYGQDIGEHIKVLLLDGSEIVGEIQDIDDDQIVLLNEALGEYVINRDDISSIAEAPKAIERTASKNSNEWFVPPIASINYLTETAIPLKKNEVYYQNILLFGQKFGFGISDHFTLNAGIELYSPMYEGRFPALLIAPKYSFSDRTKNYHFGIGGNFLVLPGDQQEDIAGTFYLINTFGDPELNLTIGIGAGFYSGDFANEPIYQLSGNARIAKHFGLVFDSLSVYDGGDLEHLGSFFIRYMNSKIIIDLGSVFEIGFSYGIPMANLAIRLSN